MFERQDDALERRLRRFSRWFENLSGPAKLVFGGVVLVVVGVIFWLELRDLLRFLGL